MSPRNKPTGCLPETSIDQLAQIESVCRDTPSSEIAVIFTSDVLNQRSDLVMVYVL
jgi:hypothetical protein